MTETIKKELLWSVIKETSWTSFPSLSTELAFYSDDFISASSICFSSAAQIPPVPGLPLCACQSRASRAAPESSAVQEVPFPVPEVSSVLAKARPSCSPPHPTLTGLTPFPSYWGPRESTAMSVLRTQSRTITGQKKERSSTDALQLMDLIFTRFTKYMTKQTVLSLSPGLVYLRDQPWGTDDGRGCIHVRED